MRIYGHKPVKMRTNNIFVPSVAWKFKVSWEKEAKAKSEVDMNGEIKNASTLTLAIWNTNEFRFLQICWKGLKMDHLGFFEEENSDERASMCKFSL